MPPEHSDWPGQQQPQAGSSGPGPAGFAQAGLAEAPASDGPAAASTLVVRTRSAEHTLQSGKTYRIGRDPPSDIIVDDARVSWRHSVLRAQGDGWLLEDVGSTNGTFVGLQRIDRVPITANCVVRLGNPDDGPVLRCMPQPGPPAPAVRQAQAAAPAAGAPPLAPLRARPPPAAPPPPPRPRRRRPGLANPRRPRLRRPARRPRRPPVSS